MLSFTLLGNLESASALTWSAVLVTIVILIDKGNNSVMVSQITGRVALSHNEGPHI